MSRILTIVIFMIAATLVQAQERAGVDTVMRLTPGTMQNNGQGPAFFPRNVFGEPASERSDTVPVTDPRQICSIGLGGEIIIGFRDRVIVDAAGDDFTIFENAFRYAGTRIYAEPAQVAVSTDGVTWTSFPFDSLTLHGCAGVTPLVGDGFDLATIGVDSVRWIKITDVTSVILSNPSHPYYDPTLTGFDLDAVVSDHTVRVALDDALSVIPRTTTVDISITAASAEFLVCDPRGAILSSEWLSRGVHQRSLNTYVQTCLMVMLRTDTSVSTVKVLR
jgi:hypothetical protein